MVYMILSTFVLAIFSGGLNLFFLHKVFANEKHCQRNSDSVLIIDKMIGELQIIAEQKENLQTELEDLQKVITHDINALRTSGEEISYDQIIQRSRNLSI